MFLWVLLLLLNKVVKVLIIKVSVNQLVPVNKVLVLLLW